MSRPSPKIVVVIAADPLRSHRAVEALRIALGLGSHNEGADICIILSGCAPFLLSDDTSDIIHGDILEKHLPVFIEWNTVFSVTTDAEVPSAYVQGCLTQLILPQDAATTLEAADRVFIFS